MISSGPVACSPYSQVTSCTAPAPQLQLAPTGHLWLFLQCSTDIACPLRLLACHLLCTLRLVAHDRYVLHINASKLEASRLKCGGTNLKLRNCPGIHRDQLATTVRGRSCFSLEPIKPASPFSSSSDDMNMATKHGAKTPWSSASLLSALTVVLSGKSAFSLFYQMPNTGATSAPPCTTAASCSRPCKQCGKHCGVTHQHTIRMPLFE